MTRAFVAVLLTLGAAAVPISIATPAVAQAAPAQAAPTFTLDTPIETLAANPAAKAVLDRDLPGITTHAMWDMIKGMSLNELAPMSNGKITPERLKIVAAELAQLKG